ncbi:hypothetical protein HYU16_01395 [Candidatus Woesearchaeota archaeon]|nr:hypothetical protein [Candidatus Woesearchaeota archaeon]
MGPLDALLAAEKECLTQLSDLKPSSAAIADAVGSLSAKGVKLEEAARVAPLAIMHNHPAVRSSFPSSCARLIARRGAAMQLKAREVPPVFVKAITNQLMTQYQTVRAHVAVIEENYGVAITAPDLNAYLYDLATRLLRFEVDDLFEQFGSHNDVRYYADHAKEYGLA